MAARIQSNTVPSRGKMEPKTVGRPRKLPSGLQNRGGMYYCAFRAGGRLVRKKLSSDFKVACDLLAEMKARAARADFGLTDNDYRWDVLKAEFLKWKRQSSRGPEEYERSLALFEEYCRVQSVRQIDVKYVCGFRAWRLGQGVTARTVNKQVGNLNHMLNVAVEWRRIGYNPIAGLDPLPCDTFTKQRRSLTVDEVNALFEHSPAHLRPVWRMFMTTGMRKDELVQLRFSDVDFDRKTVTIRADVAKNHKSREVPLDDDMLATIARLQQEAAHRRPVGHRDTRIAAGQKAAFSREHIFVTTANTPWRNNLLTRFYTCCRKARIEGAERQGSVDIHALRVSFVTLSIGYGAAPKAVQKIVGHSTLNLTMGVYAKATDHSMREAIGKLPFTSVSAPEHVISLENERRVCASSKSLTQTIVTQGVG